VEALTPSQVEDIAVAAGVPLLSQDVEIITRRMNALIELSKSLDELQLNDAVPIPPITHPNKLP
jgi:hypothetical protein